QRAGHVTVAGGGPTGVELAAEIKAAYPAKTVLLLHLGAQLLGGDSTAPLVERELRAMGVELHKGAKATSVDRESRPDGTIVVTLSDGGSFETDAYLSTSGQVPNTRWMPKNLLTDKGYVDVDDATTRHKKYPNVWSAGDASSLPTSKTAAAITAEVGAPVARTSSSRDTPVGESRAASCSRRASKSTSASGSPS
ncbi:MAG: hypothetical protein B7X77_07360, partial [Caulobacter sp. 39-67-4]